MLADFLIAATHVELELCVEVVVGDEVDLAEPGVHVALRGRQPDHRGGAVRLPLALRARILRCSDLGNRAAPVSQIDVTWA